MENENLGVDSLEPEEYFKEVLGENSEDFLMLKRLVEESEGKISWDDLKKYTRIENGEVEGIYREGDLYLEGTRISTLGKLKRVGGYLDLEGVKTLEDLGELEEVGGYLNLRGVGTLEDLGELEKVGGELDLMGTRIRSLGKLKRVGGYLNLYGVDTLKDLGELEEVGGYLDLRWTGTLEDLGELKEIKGDLNLIGTSVDVQLKVIEKINKGELQVKGKIHFGGDIDGIERLLEERDIPGNLDLGWARISTLGKLKRVRGNLDLEGVGTLKDLGELEEVGGYLDLRGTSIESLGKLKGVGGDLNLSGVGTLKDLGELKEVRGNLYLSGTKISTLGKLQGVGGDLNLEGVDTLEDLGELKKVGGYLNLRLTRIEVQLEALEKKKEGKLMVGGDLYIDELIEEIMSVDLEINFKSLESKYGNNVDDIGDIEIRDIIIGILTRWLGYKKRERAKEIAEIIGKEGLSKEDKIEAILELDRKYKELKQKLEGYGISLDK